MKSLFLRSALFASILLSTSLPATAQTTQTAIFAGGCFWCTESDFDKVPGVISTTSGYIGGNKKDPSYEEVSAGASGHAEAVEIVFDPSKVSYQQLLDYFWHSIDPTTANAQFCDHGSQYRSGIFYLNEEQKRLAEQSKTELEKSKPFKDAIVTEITQATQFYQAEEYHQNFHARNPVRYNYYRWGCGRDKRLAELWGEKK